MMNRTYQVSNVTCSGCQAKIKHLLSSIDGVENVEVEVLTGKTDVKMQKDIKITSFQEALKAFPKYQIIEQPPISLPPPQPKITYFATKEDIQKKWLTTYTPILLIFGYISAVSILVGFQYKPTFDYLLAMNVFMAGFFLVFSFFKLLNLKGFAESYAMYDIVAKQWKNWGYVYAFVELGLGLAYLTNINHFVTNWMALIVMSVSIVGVLQSVLNKQKIRCACLGAVFNLPMSTITIIEDALMIIMSTTMLILM